ncbi:MAG TPA: FkbM family methyltransferase [Vicinamibacterales bacterium]|jgi:hypothetical protein
MARSALTRHVIERRLWGDTPFFLIDVGCSGGIEKRWDVFGDRLRAVGFDPLISEVDRLNSVNTRPSVLYEAAFVGCADYDARFPRDMRKDPTSPRTLFDRTSAAAAQSRQQMSYIQEVFNSSAPLVLSTRRVVLDEYLPPGEREQVDFIKVDTDGHDIEVVLGATGIMDAGGLLGLHVEAQFQGPHHELANTFSNIDRVMRSHGFSLFDLSTNRYSRAELPATFVYDIAAQTVSGQLMWGDALYFRDLAAPLYEKAWRYTVTPERVMKLACLYEHFGLADCAAELIVKRGTFLDASTRGELLDLLAGGGPGAYRELMSAFQADPTSFFRSRRGDGAEPIDQKAHDLRERIETLKAKNAQLRERLRDRKTRSQSRVR